MQYYSGYCEEDMFRAEIEFALFETYVSSLRKEKQHINMFF